VSAAFEVQRLGASRPEARLADHFHGVLGDLAVFDGPGGRSLARTTVRMRGGSTYWLVERYAVSDEGALGALDRTLFCADAAGFSELAQHRSADGPNLHAAPIRLPATLLLGQWHTPWPDVDAAVRLEHAGPVVLQLRAQTARVDAVCLRARQGGDERVQWLARGVGEVAIGASDDALERWLVGYRSDDGRVVLADVDARLRHAERPALPAGTTAGPRRSLF